MSATRDPQRRGIKSVASGPVGRTAGLASRARPGTVTRKIETVLDWDGWVKVTALITSFATVAALVFTAKALTKTQEQIGLTEQGQYTDRFGKAVEQLGSDKIAVRLGGIYALERLAHDSARDHATIVEVLSSYVRDKAPASPCPQPNKDPVAAKFVPPSDVQAAITTLGRRDVTQDHYAKVDLRGACLAGAELSDSNFAGANFERTNLQDAMLDNANLSGALPTSSDLTNAKLVHANLSDANLTEAILRNTYLAAANLNRANLHKATLTGAYLGQATGISSTTGGADLVGAQFEPPAVLEMRTVELLLQARYNWVDIDYWRHDSGFPGDLQIDQTGLFTIDSAAIAATQSTTAPGWPECRSTQTWVARVEFNTLQPGSYLCGRSRSGRYASLKVISTPGSVNNKEKFIFEGTVWDLK